MDEVSITACDLVADIASHGVEEELAREPGPEEMVGVERGEAPIYSKGNKNLKGIFNSDIPETLAGVLAEN